MSASTWPWGVLGMEGPVGDVRAVRRAYARALKAIDPAQDIPGFEALRKAYEAALQRAEMLARRAAAEAAAGLAPDSAPPDPGPADAPSADPSIEPSAAPPADPAPVLVLPSDPGSASAPAPASQRPKQSRPLRAPVDTEARERARRGRLALKLFEERAGLGLVSQAIAGLTGDADLLGAEARDSVRRALVTELRNHLRPPFQGQPAAFSEAITRADLARIDRRLGWMADHKAMRTDLGRDPQLMEAVVDRLVGREAIAKAERGKLTWTQRVAGALAGKGRIFLWIGVIVGFQLLRLKSVKIPDWAAWPIIGVGLTVVLAVFLPRQVGHPLGRLLRRVFGGPAAGLRRGIVWWRQRPRPFATAALLLSWMAAMLAAIIVFQLRQG